MMMGLQMIVVDGAMPFCVDPDAIVALESELTTFVGHSTIERFGRAPVDRAQLVIRLRCGHTVRTGYMDVDAASRMMDGLHLAANRQSGDDLSEGMRETHPSR